MLNLHFLLSVKLSRSGTRREFPASGTGEVGGGAIAASSKMPFRDLAVADASSSDDGRWRGLGVGAGIRGRIPGSEP